MDGQPSVEIAEALEIHENTVWKWRTRWAKAQQDLRCVLARLQPDGEPCPLPKLAEAIAEEFLTDAPRSGAPPRVHGRAGVRDHRDGLPQA
jgi:transposase-like protein